MGFLRQAKTEIMRTSSKANPFAVQFRQIRLCQKPENSFDSAKIGQVQLPNLTYGRVTKKAVEIK